MAYDESTAKRVRRILSRRRGSVGASGWRRKRRGGERRSAKSRRSSSLLPADRECGDDLGNTSDPRLVLFGLKDMFDVFAPARRREVLPIVQRPRLLRECSHQIAWHPVRRERVIIHLDRDIDEILARHTSSSESRFVNAQMEDAAAFHQ